jgi:bis(5'-nucleosyl)-tetraphosphatase (symmetrical)
MATYAIGDVQGCDATLAALLGRIAFDPRRDRAILVGDAVNRGPGSLAVLRWAMASGDAVEVLLGNHEMHAIARHLGVARAKSRDTLDDLLAQPDADEIVSWLRARPLAVRAGRWLVVHAGVLPVWSVADTLRLAQEVEGELVGPRAPELLASLVERPGLAWSEDLAGAERLRAIAQALTQLRTCDPEGRPALDFKGRPEDAPPGHRPWFECPGPWASEVTVAFGHWARLGLHVAPHAVCLDTGAAWGGELTALRLEDGGIVHQPVVDRIGADPST